MELDVPILRQKKKSLDCGLVCCQMVLEYFGIKVDFDLIRNEIPITEGLGSFSPQWASLLNKFGLRTEIITMHPKLFRTIDSELKKEDIVERYKSILEKTELKHDKIAAEYFIRYLKKGSVKIELPTLKHIESAIDQERLCIVCYTSRFLHTAKPKFNYHACVITGYDDEYIYVNDPSSDEFRGGKQKCSKDQFLFAFYGALSPDIDNGSILIVGKS